jgi:hypothetical protein
MVLFNAIIYFVVNRQIYEGKAAAINEAEGKKYQHLLMQTQRRQQQLQIQQQQQQKQQMMLHHQQQRQAIRARLYPSKHLVLTNIALFKIGFTVTARGIHLFR